MRDVRPATDTIGDGVAEFDPAAGQTVFRLGTGANDTSGGRLEPGQTACARFRVQVAADATRTSEIVNQGRASFVGLTLGTQFPEELSNPVTNVVAGADLVPTKVHAGGTFVGGQPYNFTIGVANNGDLPTTGGVTVEDTFDPVQFSSVNSAAGTGWECTTEENTVSCTRSDPLPVGQPYPPITVNATVADPVPATVINTATVSGGGDIDDTNNSATDAGGAIAQADLAITKVVDQAVVPARGEVNFTLDVVNSGPSTATAVQVTDTLAPNFDAIEVTSTSGSCTDAVVCTLGAMARGERDTITIRARVLDAAVDSAVTNLTTVTDTGASDDPSAGNNTADAIVDVPVSSDLQVGKTFTPTPNPTAGDFVTYTVAVTNAGPSTANNVSLRDILPAEYYATAPEPTGTFTGGGTCEWLEDVRTMRCAIDSLPPGQTETQTITITARLAPDSRGKTVLNSIGAISDSVDPNPALAQDTVSFVPIPAADLELTKIGPPDPVAPGAVGRYALQIANRGPSDAPDVTVRDTLPDGLTFVGDTAGACSATGQAVTCVLGALNAGASRELGIDVRVDTSLAGQTVRNAASVASEPADPTLAPAEVIPSSNFDESGLVVGPREVLPPPPGLPLSPSPSLDVAVNVRPPASPYTVGEPGSWRVAVVNNGPAAASAVELELSRRGARVDDLGVGAAQAGCRVGGACALGSLAVGERRTLAVRLRPLEAERLTLAAEVSPAETDTAPPNNTDEASINPRLAVVGVDVTATSRRLEPGEVLGVVTAVKTRKRRPARATRVCVRVPQGLAIVRRGGARLRDGRACWRIRRIAGNRSRRFRLRLRAIGATRSRRMTLTAAATGPYVRDNRARVSVLVLPAQAPGVTG